MISTGLSAADQRIYEASLLEDHAIDVQVNLLDMDQNVVASSLGSVTGGQVDVDSSQDVERTCTVDVTDPGNDLGLLGTPTVAPDWPHLMVQIIYRVWVSGLGRWVDVPVFTGPITSATPTDGGVTISGAGKESLLTVATNRTYNFAAGRKRSDVILAILEMNGENFRQITSYAPTTTAATVIAAKDAPWPVMKQLARAIVYDSSNYPWLGYNGRGYCVLRSHSAVNRWTFQKGDGSLLSKPTVTHDISALCNFVVAVNNASGKIVALSRPARTHPLSPESLGRGSVPRFLRSEIDTDVSDAETAQALTDSALNVGLTAGADVSFDCMVVPHLEPRDVVTVNPGTWMWKLQLNKFTIPLTADKMTIGRNSQSSAKARSRAIIRRSR